MRLNLADQSFTAECTGRALGPLVTDDRGFEQATISEFAAPVLACEGPHRFTGLQA